MNPVTYGNLLFINSMIPSTPEVCVSTSGTGWLMAVDIYNGGEPEFPPLDVNNDNVFDENDATTNDELAIGTKIDGIPTESKFVSDKRITVDSEKNVNVESGRYAQVHYRRGPKFHKHSVLKCWKYRRC